MIKGRPFEKGGRVSPERQSAMVAQSMRENRGPLSKKNRAIDDTRELYSVFTPAWICAAEQALTA